jgi:hypothetical protein
MVIPVATGWEIPGNCSSVHPPELGRFVSCGPAQPISVHSSEPSSRPRSSRPAWAHNKTLSQRQKKKPKNSMYFCRFEMPYNIWCDGCKNHIGMGESCPPL